MFTQSDEKQKESLEGIADFISKPSQNCPEEELKKGVEKIKDVLEKNPYDVLRIVIGDPMVPATYIWGDLVEKMEKQKALKSLEVIFDKCSDQLIIECVYNFHDLERCVNKFPNKRDIILKSINSTESVMLKIIKADDDPRSTLNQIKEKYPQYAEAFSETFKKNFEHRPH